MSFLCISKYCSVKNLANCESMVKEKEKNKLTEIYFLFCCKFVIPFEVDVFDQKVPKHRNKFCPTNASFT